MRKIAVLICSLLVFSLVGLGNFVATPIASAQAATPYTPLSWSPGTREEVSLAPTSTITTRDTGEAVWVYDVVIESKSVLGRFGESGPARVVKVKFHVEPNELTYILDSEEYQTFNESYLYEGENITPEEFGSLKSELGEIPVKQVSVGSLERTQARPITPPSWVSDGRGNPATFTVTLVREHPGLSGASFTVGQHSLVWTITSEADWDTGAHDNTVSWQGKLRLEWPLVRENYLAVPTGFQSPRGVEWSPHDPKLLVAVGSVQDTIDVFSYDDTTGALVRENYLTDPTAIEWPRGASWSPHDPKLIASIGGDTDTIAIFSYDNVTKSLVRENYLVDTAAIDKPEDVSWSPHDPDLIAVVGELLDTIAVFSYDNATKSLVRENYLADSDAIDTPYCVSWSPHDPKLIAAVGEMSGTIAIFSYDDTTGALVREAYLKDTTALFRPYEVSWSPHDPKLLAVVDGYTDVIAVYSYDNVTKDLVRENYLADVTAIEKAYGVSWSPHDPKLIAAVGQIGTIAVFSYDNFTGALIREAYLSDTTAMGGSFGVSWSPHDPKLLAAIGDMYKTIAVFSSLSYSSHGAWTSAWHDWGGVAVYDNVEISASILAGTDNVKVEVTDNSGGLMAVDDSTAWVPLSDGSNTVDLTGLQNAQYVRVRFQMSPGSSTPKNQDYTLNSHRTPPAVDSNRSENVDAASADLVGELIDTRGWTDNIKFQIREKGAPTWENFGLQTVTSPDNYAVSKTGLKDNTIYEWRFVGTPEAVLNENTGATKEFTTDYPRVGWQSRTEVTSSGFKVTATIENKGEPSLGVYVQHRKLGTTTWSEELVTDAAGTKNYTHELTGLVSDTVYEVRWKLVGSTYYSSIWTVETQAVVGPIIPPIAPRELTAEVATGIWSGPAGAEIFTEMSQFERGGLVVVRVMVTADGGPYETANVTAWWIPDPLSASAATIPITYAGDGTYAGFFQIPFDLTFGAYEVATEAKGANVVPTTGYTVFMVVSEVAEPGVFEQIWEAIEENPIPVIFAVVVAAFFVLMLARSGTKGKG